MYIVAFFIGFLFWKSCKFWRRLRALDYIWKSGVGFTLFYFTNLFVEILGRKGSGTMIFIVSWCYGGLAMVIFILFWQGSYPPWWHHTGIVENDPQFLDAFKTCTGKTNTPAIIQTSRRWPSGLIGSPSKNKNPRKSRNGKFVKFGAFLDCVVGLIFRLFVVQVG